MYFFLQENENQNIIENTIFIEHKLKGRRCYTLSNAKFLYMMWKLKIRWSISKDREWNHDIHKSIHNKKITTKDKESEHCQTKSEKADWICK